MLDDILRLTKLVETMKFEFIKLNEPSDMWDSDDNFNGFVNE
jgi:hypothetical protein